MRALPLEARVYLAACYTLGFVTVGWLLLWAPSSAETIRDWVLGLALAGLAGTVQFFAVLRSENKYSDHLTPVPLFAGLLLLPSPLLIPLVALAFIPEWIGCRRAWYIQCFNIATWLITLTLGKIVLVALTGHARMPMGDAYRFPAEAIVLALLVVLFSQSMLLATVLRVARGQRLKQTGLLEPSKLFVEASLLVSGWALAAAWLLDPLYGLATLLPLALIFQALHVPNLRREASTDPKTGLANSRYFNHMLDRELERARRGGQPVSLLMCDLDYLRNINNTYGHQAGDVVLVGVANIIRQCIRASDVPGRFGGEEFCVLLADTDVLGARQAAERIRQLVEGTPFPVGRSDRFLGATVSIGVANCPSDGHSAETLMHEADLAVYKAKRDGRNRVVVAGRDTRELAAEWARENLIPQIRSRTPAPTQVIRQFLATAAPNTNQGNPVPTAAGAAGTGASGGAQPKDGQPSTKLAPRAGLTIPVALFIGLVCAASILGLMGEATISMSVGRVPWLALGVFAVSTILAEQLALDVGGGRGKTSVSVTVILAASFLFGALGSLATVLTFAVWTKIKSKSLISRLLFDFGMILLAAEIGNWVFNLLSGGVGGGQPIGWLFVAATAAGLVYYGVNHLLLSVARGLAEKRNPWVVWCDNYQWLWPHYAVFGALALVVALGYQFLGAVGVVVLMAPVAMMHLAIKQYMDRTTVYVQELERLNSRLGDSYEATLLALTRALDTRDDETEEHSRRVRRYTELIARYLQISGDDLENLLRGALLHDIGKIGVPDAILLKPAKLTDEERALMRKHPVIGYSMITHIPFLAKAAEIVLHHHEAYDGGGYPSGLAGERIPLGARVFALADTLDAMTSDRPYRKALPISAALAEIERCRGSQFDPNLVDLLHKIPIEELLVCATGQPEAAKTNKGLLRGELRPVVLAS